MSSKRTQKPPVTMRDRPTVRLRSPNYQPNKAELLETVRVPPDMTAEELARAVTRPVNIVYQN